MPTELHGCILYRLIVYFHIPSSVSCIISVSLKTSVQRIGNRERVIIVANKADIVEFLGRETGAFAVHHKTRGVRRISFREGLEHMVSAVARAYKGGGSGGGAPSGVQGQSPWWRIRGRSP